MPGYPVPMQWRGCSGQGMHQSGPVLTQPHGSREPLFSSLSPLPHSSPRVGHAPPARFSFPHLNTISQWQNTVPDILGVFPTVLLPGAGGAGLVVL